MEYNNRYVARDIKKNNVNSRILNKYFFSQLDLNNEPNRIRAENER